MEWNKMEWNVLCCQTWKKRPSTHCLFPGYRYMQSLLPATLLHVQTGQGTRPADRRLAHSKRVLDMDTVSFPRRFISTPPPSPKLTGNSCSLESWALWNSFAQPPLLPFLTSGPALTEGFQPHTSSG